MVTACMFVPPRMLKVSQRTLVDDTAYHLVGKVDTAAAQVG